MRKLRLRKSMKAAWITAAMTLAGSSLAFGAAQALPNGTIVNVGGVNYLTDPQGERYSGWFIDAGENWYYFNESDKTMKTGWHHDREDGYWYYLNPADGKMVDGWQTIDGKEYFFQPVRNMGNYFFNSEQEKWLYSLNSNVPYGAMYRSTVTPDGSTVDETGAKVTGGSQAAAVQNGWVTQNGKKYYFENGIMVSGGWKTIGGKSYYFGSDGTLYVNTTTPDGVKVDGNGAKVEISVSLTNEQVRKLIGILDYVHLSLYFQTEQEHQTAIMSNYNVSSGMLTPKQKAWVLWVYECLYDDSRVSQGSGSYSEFNKAKKSDMKNIMKEIFGSASAEEMQAFVDSWVRKEDSNYYYMESATGNFGSAEDTYFETQEGVDVSIENGRLKISGIMYLSLGGEYVPYKSFTGYFVPGSGTALYGYQFDQLIIQ